MGKGVSPRLWKHQKFVGRSEICQDKVYVGLVDG